MNALISICIPTYNGEKYLRECLNSVLAQTYKETEIIVVDDRSSDGTVKLVEEYAGRDSRISLYKNDLNLGLVGNWNRCMEIAKGEWIKFAFQDDLLAPDCIEKMLNASGDHSFVVSDREFIFDEFVSAEMKDYFTTKVLTLKKLIKTSSSVFITDREVSEFAADHISLNFIGEPTAVMFKRNLTNEVRDFNADLSQICDLEFWLRIGTKKGLVYVPETLASFRIHASSTTSKNITGSKNFKANYLDIVILVHEMLYSPLFSYFRSLISGKQKNKLLLYLKVKLYEAKLAFEIDNTVDRNFFDEFLLKYPELKKFYNASFATKIVQKLVAVKRKFD